MHPWICLQNLDRVRCFFQTVIVQLMSNLVVPPQNLDPTLLLQRINTLQDEIHALQRGNRVGREQVLIRHSMFYLTNVCS